MSNTNAGGEQFFNLMTACPVCGTVRLNTLVGNYTDSRSIAHVNATVGLIETDVRYMQRKSKSTEEARDWIRTPMHTTAQQALSLAK